MLQELKNFKNGLIMI